MQRPQRGASPEGWRIQLLARLRNRARDAGVAAQRFQQRVAFERLLARLPGTGDWVLKSGLGLELRYGWGQRPTRDVDLRVAHGLDEAMDALRLALAEATIDDHFSFDLGEAVPDTDVPASLRIPVRAMVAGTTFAQFHVDLSSGDALVGDPDIVVGSDLLSFADIDLLRFPVYPVAQQLAEKLHAYTFPRAQENTRVKDFVDLVVVAALETVRGGLLATSLHATFEARATHSLPASLPAPPTSWTTAFARLSRDAPNTPTTELEAAYRLAQSFWNPVLTGEARDLVWSPARARWVHSR